MSISSTSEPVAELPHGMATSARAAGINWRTRIRRILERNPAQYRFLLKLRGASLSPAPVSAHWMGRALQTGEEAREAVERVRRAGLRPHPDAPKNWDALAALDLILSREDRTERILDAGGETYSPLMEWLSLYGYRALDVINLAFAEESFVRGPIRYLRGDATRTPFEDASFDVITCLSVIEHGVPVDAFIKECSRLLRPGGQLVISTDFWSEPINTAGRTAYGTDVKIFTPDDIRQLVDVAGSLGMIPAGEIEFATHEKVVHWRSQDLHFTFLVFALTKVA